MKSLYALILALSVLFASCDSPKEEKKPKPAKATTGNPDLPVGTTPTLNPDLPVGTTLTLPPIPADQPRLTFIEMAVTKSFHRGRTYFHPLITVAEDGAYTMHFTSQNNHPLTTVAEDKRAITYQSDNHEVATVDANTGVVTFVAVGEVTITATQKATAGKLASIARYTLYLKLMTKDALADEIKKAMDAHGNDADLNHIDTSAITDMSYLFSSDKTYGYGLSAFNGDISKWDVSSVTNMEYMFERATAFNSNISGWQVQNVTNMRTMFYGATAFKQNLNAWGRRLNAEIKSRGWWFRVSGMFFRSGLEGSLPKWCEDVKECKDLQ